MEEAIAEAQKQKRRVRGRLADMRGEFGSTPVRGPWKPGRPGVKWHLYQAVKLLQWFLLQCQGDSGTGESHWEQFEEYRIARMLVRRMESEVGK